MATVSARRARLAQLDATEFETGTANIEADLALKNRIADSTRGEVLETQLQSESRVVSPYAGQVLEIKVSAGGLVPVGTPIISLQPDVETLEAVLYVPAERAKDLRPGMDAEILPTTVSREEYGFIRGKVDFVSDYPATEAATMRVFENAPLVQALSARGPVTEVRVEMAADSTPSGYRWSSPLGAPITLSGGTLCLGDIVTRRQRPINLVVPEIKSALGAELTRHGHAHAGEDADRHPDGGRGVRRGGAGDGARLLRPVRAARGAARRLRRLARRQQGAQHREGGARVRPAEQGLQEGAGAAARPAAAADRLLELQPLRGGRGLPAREGVPERSRARPARRVGPTSSTSRSPASCWCSRRAPTSSRGEQPSVVRALGARLRGARLALAYAVLATLALVLPGLVIPVFPRSSSTTILVRGRRRG